MAVPRPKNVESAPVALATSDGLLAQWLSLPTERQTAIAVLLLGALLFLPWLGAVGFWDPWEPHYGEVGRAMIARQDFVHPYWENAYFYSKPVLTLWMDAVSMLLAGTNHGAGLGADPSRGVSVATEWCVRLPYALLAIAELVFVCITMGRIFSRRVGILAAIALATCPMFVLLARQAVTDGPFVAINTIGFCCLILALFEREEPQVGWLYTFYACVGLGTLAKESLGIALPGATMLAYILLTGEWSMLKKLRLFSGALVVGAIAAPWYTAMLVFDGKDDESKTFLERLRHDNINRFLYGVHTTTPGGTFIYFIEQLGFGVFPWVAAVPGALSEMFRTSISDRSRESRVRLLLVLWAAISFAVFTLSATKFHHYCFPILPPLLILCALWLDRVLTNGVRAEAVALLLGGVLFALIANNLFMTPKHLTDLFVYNYERPYPDREVDPRNWFRAIFVGGAVVALWPFVVTLLESFGSRRAETEPKPNRLFVTGAAYGTALVFAFYLSWFHWRALTPHWTQREIFWTYLEQAKPDEPIIAYYMNWRGETFYSRNTVRQVKDTALMQQLAAQPGRKWVIVEHNRLAGLKQTLGANYKVNQVDQAGDKFALVTVD